MYTHGSRHSNRVLKLRVSKNIQPTLADRGFPSAADLAELRALPHADEAEAWLDEAEASASFGPNCLTASVMARLAAGEDANEKQAQHLLACDECSAVLDIAKTVGIPDVAFAMILAEVPTVIQSSDQKSKGTSPAKKHRFKRTSRERRVRQHRLSTEQMDRILARANPCGNGTVGVNDFRVATAAR